jgi:hypothetical protein
MLRPALFAALLLLTAAVSAQGLSITASGRVQAVGPGACDPAATHTFQCGPVLLHSKAVELAALVGNYVTLSGTARVAPGCTQLSVEVTDAKSADSRVTTFSLTNYRIGSNVTVFTTAPVGAVFLHFFAVEQFVLPLGSFGTLFLQPTGTQNWANGIGIGFPFPSVLAIPNSTALVGCSPNFQALVVDAANPLESALTNDACFVIRG